MESKIAKSTSVVELSAYMTPSVSKTSTAFSRKFKSTLKNINSNDLDKVGDASSSQSGVSLTTPVITATTELYDVSILEDTSSSVTNSSPDQSVEESPDSGLAKRCQRFKALFQNKEHSTDTSCTEQNKPTNKIVSAKHINNASQSNAILNQEQKRVSSDGFYIESESDLTSSRSKELNNSDFAGNPVGLFSHIKTAFDKTSTTVSNHTTTQRKSMKMVDKSVNISNTHQQKDISSENTKPCDSEPVAIELTDILVPLRVLVHQVKETAANLKIKEIKSIEDANFHPEILKGVAELQGRTVTRIQRVVWPALVQGESVVMVQAALPGNITCYTAPIMNNILETQKHSKLSDGTGPLALIVAPSSESCEKIYANFKTFFKFANIRVLIAYAGEDGRKTSINLTNGCHILVTTPRCFLRLLAMPMVTDLKRIGYVVLHETDILLEKFSSEIKIILEKCHKSIQQRRRKATCKDIQVLLYAHMWQMELKNLIQILAPNPVICIGSYLEAAIYAQLKPSLELLNTKEKQMRLQELVKENLEVHKIIIFGKNAQEVVKIVSLLNPHYPNVLQVDERMNHINVLSVFKSWRSLVAQGLHPIFVCSENTLTELSIFDATCLIHYSLPEAKPRFSMRFSYLMENYHNVYFNQKKIDCKVYIFIGDENRCQFPGVLNFMKRLGATILPALEEAGKEVLLETERSKIKVPVCESLKSFGECWDKLNCTFRHVFLEKDHLKNLPQTGYVKLKVLNVKSASHFMARLLEHTDSEGVTHSSRNVYLKITKALKSHFCKPENRLTPRHPKVGDICAYENELGIFSRVTVTKRESRSKRQYVTCECLDTGTMFSCHLSNLFKLPEHIQEIPSLAVNVYICRVQPPDLDSDWNTNATGRVQTWLYETEELEEDGPFIMGNIKLSLHNSLWLDPIQKRQCLPSHKSKTGLILMDFRQQMVTGNIAVNNPQHLSKLYDICRECGIEVCTSVSSSTVSVEQKLLKQLPQPQWAFLSDEDINVVFFTSGDSPRQFFVCLCKFVRLSKRLNKEIQQYVSEYKPLEDDMIIQAGVLCLGRFPTDGLWYRAQVLKVSEDGRVELQFVDYGDRAFVSPVADIIPIHPRHIKNLPFQAIECSLGGIEPSNDGSWADEATDELYEMSVNSRTDYRKPMYISILGKEKHANQTGGHKYSVLLACKGDDDEQTIIVLNENFLNRGFAQLCENDKCGFEKCLEQFMKNINLASESSSDSDSDLKDDDDDFKPIIGLETSFSSAVDTNTSGMKALSKTAEDNDGTTDNKTELSTSNSTALQPVRSKGNWIPDEVYNGFADFDFEMGDKEESVEAFIRNFIGLEPKKKYESYFPSMSKADHPSSTHIGSPSSVRQSSNPPRQSEGVPSTSGSNSLPCKSEASASAAASASGTLQEALGLKKPQVIWHQDQTSVTMSVEIINVQPSGYILQSDKTSVSFTTDINNETYAFDVQFYGTIAHDWCEHESTGRRVKIKLMKRVPGMWPRLQKAKMNPWWLKYNMDMEDPTDIPGVVRVNRFGEAQLSYDKSEVTVELPDSETDDSEYEEDDRDFERKDPFDPLS